jgi:alanyl-tRNA synthetase
MKKLTGNQLRSMYIQYFVDQGHKQIKGASLIPENDPSVLFTTAGMHPLVPYLLGAKHPMGTRLTDVQKCVRTGDIDDVGDNSHATFFEMLGNWSLGDYFKKEAISWSYRFLTSPDYLGIDPDRLAFTVFAGDDDVPRDMESYEIWRSLGVPEDRIFFLPRKDNWWETGGATGPCGPDTEMFLIMKEPCGPDCNPGCSCGAYLEIWNDVFMEYNKKADGTYEPLPQKNVDTGMGLERTIAVLQGVSSVYETDIYRHIISTVEALCGKTVNDGEETRRAIRIVADHIRTATFIMGDERGVSPSNVDQGYVLRRLIRRAVRFGRQLDLPSERLVEVAQAVIDTYQEVYPELLQNQAFIMEQLSREEKRFSRTLEQGVREFERVAKKAQGGVIDGVTAFHLYDTYGFPIEITQEMAQEAGLTVDTKGFEAAFSEHRKKSQAGSQQRFAGGLAEANEITARLHTATHLLLASLKRVLGEQVNQRGSNITPERLRFDFNFERKMTPEEKQQVEDLVNDAIRRDLPITMEEMTVDEAKAAGATGVFTDRYGEKVKVYTMGDFSKEICGGPHAAHTGELGVFKIQKEESSSQGVRRIKAVLKAE